MWQHEKLSKTTEIKIEKGPNVLWGTEKKWQRREQMVIKLQKYPNLSRQTNKRTNEQTNIDAISAAI